MRKATRRRLGSSAWLAIALVILVPALAHAQLLPNRTIRRERPGPVQEAPFNAQVRREYFGYYPTCWSKFPDGWTCPCTDPALMPNRADSFKRIEFNKNRGAGAESDFGMAEPAMDREPGPKPDDMPAIPPDIRSPFLRDTPTPPPSQPPGPQGSHSSPKPDPSKPASAPGTGSASPAGLLEMPSLPAVSPTTSLEPDHQPGSMELVPDATLASNSDAGMARPDLGPLPTAPTPAPSSPTNYPMVVETEPATSMRVPMPARAPRRRSLIGALFGRGNTTNR